MTRWERFSTSVRAFSVYAIRVFYQTLELFDSLWHFKIASSVDVVNTKIKMVYHINTVYRNTSHCMWNTVNVNRTKFCTKHYVNVSIVLAWTHWQYNYLERKTPHGSVSDRSCFGVKQRERKSGLWTPHHFFMTSVISSVRSKDRDSARPSLINSTSKRCLVPKKMLLRWNFVPDFIVHTFTLFHYCLVPLFLL